MAFGFPVRFTKEITLENFQAKEFLVIAIEAAQYLGWKISSMNKEGFTANTRFSFIFWGELVALRVEEDKIVLQSSCLSLQLLDFGKNKRNIQHLIEQTQTLRDSFTPEKFLPDMMNWIPKSL